MLNESTAREIENLFQEMVVSKINQNVEELKQNITGLIGEESELYNIIESDILKKNEFISLLNKEAISGKFAALEEMISQIPSSTTEETKKIISLIQRIAAFLEKQFNICEDGKKEILKDYLLRQFQDLLKILEEEKEYIISCKQGVIEHFLGVQNILEKIQNDNLKEHVKIEKILNKEEKIEQILQQESDNINAIIGELVSLKEILQNQKQMKKDIFQNQKELKEEILKNQEQVKNDVLKKHKELGEEIFENQQKGQKYMLLFLENNVANILKSVENFKAEQQEKQEKLLENILFVVNRGDKEEIISAINECKNFQEEKQIDIDKDFISVKEKQQEISMYMLQQQKMIYVLLGMNIVSVLGIIYLFVVSFVP